jgi:hypothetical protein
MVALILGIIGIVLGGGTLLVSLLLPVMTHGRTSWGEAMMGVIPGSLCFAFSLILAIVGLVLVIMKKKKAAQA